MTVRIRGEQLGNPFYINSTAVTISGGLDTVNIYTDSGTNIYGGLCVDNVCLTSGVGGGTVIENNFDIDLLSHNNLSISADLDLTLIGIQVNINSPLVTITGSLTVEQDFDIYGDITVSGGMIVNGESVGNATGPGSSTDNAIARFNGTTGKLLQNSSATIDDNGAFSAPFTTGVSSITNTDGYGLSITDDASNLGFPVSVPFVGLTTTDAGVMVLGNLATSTPEAILQVMPSGFGPDTPSIELAVDDTGYDNTFATRVGASATYAYVKRSIAASPDSYNALSVASDFVSLVTADGPMSINSVDNLSLSGASSVDITAVSSNIVLSGVDITTSGTGNIIVATYGDGSTASTLDLNVDGGFGTVFGSIAQSSDNDLPRVGLIVDNTGDINLGSLVDRDTNNQGGGGGGGGGPSNIDWYANFSPDPIQNCDGTLSYDLALIDGLGQRMPILLPHGNRTQAENFLAGIGIQANALTWYSNDGGNTSSPGPVLISVGAGQSYIADTTPLTTAGGSFSSTPALTYSGGAYNGNQWTATYNGNTYDTILLGQNALNGWFIIPAMSGGGGGGSGPVNFVTSLISAENGSSVLGVKNQGIARVAVGSWWNSTTADHGLHVISNGFSRGFDIGGSGTTAYQTDETALLVPVSGTMFIGSKDSSAIYISPALGVMDSSTNYNIDHGLYLYNGSSGNNAGVMNKLVVPEGTPFTIGAMALSSGYVGQSLSFLTQGLGYGGNPSINLEYSEGYSNPKDNSLSVVLTSGNFLVDVHTDTYATNSHMALSNNGIGDFHVYVASNDLGSPSIRGVFSLAESDTYTGTMAASIGVELVDGMPTNAIVVSVSGIDMYSGVNVVKDDATTNSVVDILTLTHSTTGTAADGIGTGLAFYSEDASGNIDQAGRINCKFPTAAHATQTGQMDLAALNTTLLSLFTGATAADNRITLGAHTNYQSYVPFFTEYDNGNSGATKTFDWNNGVKQKVTMTATCSGMFTAPPGPCNLTLFITQGGSGSYTMTWPEAVKWPGGVAPSLSTAVSSIDIIAFYYNGTDYYGTASLGFA